MPQSPVLSVRVSPDERSILEMAAEASHSTLSEYTRRAALLLAEEELMRRSTIVIPGEQWADIERLVEAPAETLPEVQELAARKPIWQK